MEAYRSKDLNNERKWKIQDKAIALWYFLSRENKVTS